VTALVDTQLTHCSVWIGLKLDKVVRQSRRLELRLRNWLKTSHWLPGYLDLQLSILGDD
jgi:hypothetical protein